jgi:hypothetical protein
MFASCAKPTLASLAAAVAVLAPAGPGLAQVCPGDTTVQVFTGAGTTACPCFVPGEQAGTVFDLPATWYPLEVLRVGIGWGSAFGGAPQTLEQAIHLYEGGLPDPGTPTFTLPGPQLTDGFFNDFNIEAAPGDKTIDSGPFTVTLEFLNSNSGDFFAPSVVHDGNGCQAGKNVVRVQPGGTWSSACALGVTGDWVFTVRVRCSDPTGVEERTVASASTLLFARPNPLRTGTQIGLFLTEPQAATLAVFDVRGRVVRTIADRDFAAGEHVLRWGADRQDGARVPAGIYIVRLQTRDRVATRKVVVQE